MLSQPEVVRRAGMTYAFIALSAPMSLLSSVAPEGFSRLFDLLEASSIAPTGPAFMNYRRIDMDGVIDFEIGAPVAEAGLVGHGLQFGTLPGGDFGRLIHTGTYDKLVDANGALIAWAQAEEIFWDARRAPDGEIFACRLETYVTGPMDDPDPAGWTTEIAIKIK